MVIVAFAALAYTQREKGRHPCHHVRQQATFDGPAGCFRGDGRYFDGDGWMVTMAHFPASKSMSTASYPQS